MPNESDPTADGLPACSREDCDHDAAFWLYRLEDGRWRPLCERHVAHLHPSLEVKAWLESGYAKPVELDRPEGPPPAPRGGRDAAFRDLVEETMDWSD